MTTQRFQFYLILFVIWACPSGMFSVIGDDQNSFSGERASELFLQWREKHGKVYTDAEETEERFNNFKNNLKYISEKNSEKTLPWGHTLGLNKFADMNNEEFREGYVSKLIKKPKKKRVVVERKKPFECEAPPSLDWRKAGIVTGVKDQGIHGSSWAFSSIGAVEGLNALVTGDLIRLSERELLDSECDAGDMGHAFEWIISNGGIHPPESEYPAIVDRTRDTNDQERTNKVVTIDEYKNIEAEEGALLCAVAQQPVSVGIVGSAIDFQLYVGGIYDGICSSNPDDIDHGVLIVGYGSQGEDGGEDYWIVKNSWGTNWGMEGYAHIRRNTYSTDSSFGVCAINSMASYPLKHLSLHSSPAPYPSPGGAPPPPALSPPPPPFPPRNRCGFLVYCPIDQACCCMCKVFDICLVFTCCPYQDGICCRFGLYCCPSDYPICYRGYCLKKPGDKEGVAAKKKEMAMRILPWTKMEEEDEEE